MLRQWRTTCKRFDSTRGGVVPKSRRSQRFPECAVSPRARTGGGNSARWGGTAPARDAAPLGLAHRCAVRSGCPANIGFGGPPNGASWSVFCGPAKGASWSAYAVRVRSLVVAVVDSRTGAAARQRLSGFCVSCRNVGKMAGMSWPARDGFRLAPFRWRQRSSAGLGIPAGPLRRTCV